MKSFEKLCRQCIYIWPLDCRRHVGKLLGLLPCMCQLINSKTRRRWSKGNFVHNITVKVWDSCRFCSIKKQKTEIIQKEAAEVTRQLLLSTRTRMAKSFNENTIHKTLPQENYVNLLPIRLVSDVWLAVKNKLWNRKLAKNGKCSWSAFLRRINANVSGGIVSLPFITTDIFFLAYLWNFLR